MKNKSAVDPVTHALTVLPRATRYLVAFSGGLDSTVLLHALAHRPRRRTPVYALHVNHGLHADAAKWALWCAAFCKSHGVVFTDTSLAIPHAPGSSLEAAAREARYAWLRAHMQPGDVLLTAHHQDDQLETFLLMALRGSGPAGLAAMPAAAPFGAGQLVRPLLGSPRAVLEAYAAQYDLQWLTDPSNADTRFDRNYLRREIAPRLRDRWPAAGETISRAARHCAAAVDLLDGLAARDWVACIRADGASLSVARLAALASSRAAQCVRYWLARLGLPAPDEKRLGQLLGPMLTAGRDRAPNVVWAGVEVRRYRDGLYAMPPLPLAPGSEIVWDTRKPLVLPAGLGALHAPSKLAGESLTVRFRVGGEALQVAGQAHHRPVKKLLQEAGIVPWMRVRLPLIYQAGELVAVGDLWATAGFAPGVRWEDRPPLY